jgi:hypothetical protein
MKSLNSSRQTWFGSSFKGGHGSPAASQIVDMTEIDAAESGDLYRKGRAADRFKRLCW